MIYAESESEEMNENDIFNIYDLLPHPCPENTSHVTQQ